MSLSIVTVTGSHEVSKGIYALKLRAPMEAGRAKPGQFINLYTGDGAMLLPRPFGICDVAGGEISLVFAVVGAGTRAFSNLARGESVRIEGPMGMGLDTETLMRDYDEIYLAGGGLGIAPLIYIARSLAAAGAQDSGAGLAKTAAALGYREDAWLSKEFEGRVSKLLCISESDAGVHPKGTTGNVLDALSELMTDSAEAKKLVIACGPVAMLKATAEFAAARGAGSLLSLEAHMGCGYGACVGCTISLSAVTGETLDGDVLRLKVCKDGPFFDGSRIVWDSLGAHL